MNGRKKIKAKPKASDQVAISNKSWQAIVAQTESMAQRLCEAEGIELVHVEFQREAGGRILRLYIDQPGGVTLNDCVNITIIDTQNKTISTRALGQVIVLAQSNACNG